MSTLLQVRGHMAEPPGPTKGILLQFETGEGAIRSHCQLSKAQIGQIAEILESWLKDQNEIE